jgi:cobalt-zinc-cadmium efflux system protein
LAFGSLALLAESVHMVSDVAALGIALVAQRLITAPASDRHTYGLVRAEVLAGLANAILLLIAAGWIVVEALQRIDDDVEVDGAGVIVVALIGFAVIAGSAWMLARAGPARGHAVGDAGRRDR